ncbi:MAG: Uma2 family endonuclease [Planctomycetes bacterium]|nr:Uma2 family endonuclease [Planctomycetota bacterium]
MSTKVRFNYADFVELYADDKLSQIVDGELYVSPPPVLRHQIVSNRICYELTRHVKERNLGLVLSCPTGVVLSDEDVVLPDILYVSHAHAHILAPEGLRGAPDLCVEVLSPSTRKLDLEAKRKLYAKHGVAEYWIVDGEADTLTCYQPQKNADKPAAVVSPPAKFKSPLLQGLELDLAAVFSR